MDGFGTSSIFRNKIYESIRFGDVNDLENENRSDIFDRISVTLEIKDLWKAILFL